MRRDAFFRVDASLMQQLGASLISDDLQCLIELIKNAYDADSTRVRIVIDAPDRIVVEDDGQGMDEATITRGWLTISNSLKMEQKMRGELTARQRRTPLGDKGLGRLSTQRLGSRLRIETVPDGHDALLSVEIDWSAFTPGKDLSQIPVEFDVSKNPGRKHGTRLIITELHSPEEWSNLDEGQLRLQLASLVSPYQKVASFRIQAFLNGSEVSPSVVGENVRKAAGQSFTFSFDGKDFECEGQIKLQTLRGTTIKGREQYRRYLEEDGGDDFLRSLLSDPRSSGYSLAAASEPYFVTFRRRRALSDIGGTTILENPGPFSGEVDSFSLDPQATDEVMESTDALSSSAEAKQLVKDLSGIRVYRDGFAIRTAHDWLRLGEGQTSGGSFYGLRPFNTMGYVAVSAARNPQLRETTDREGFVQDAYYASFYTILKSFTKTTADVLEHVRRFWVAYAKRRDEAEAGLGTRDPKAIEENLADSFHRVDDAKAILTDASRQITQVLSEEEDSLFPHGIALSGKLADVQELLGRASQILDEVGARRGLPGLLAAEINALDARLGEVYELVSLGITAEALSHDISVLLERLRAETRSIQKYANNAGVTDVNLLRYFETVRAAISGLERQLGHLDPALRYVREKREAFSVASMIEQSAEYYRERLSRNEVTLSIETSRDFRVLMNPGKLIQVLDNLVLNSEYWLRSPKITKGASKHIGIVVDRPSIIVEDSGLGVEPAFEESLFDPFVTSKPRGQGRGLGLFIATQLLGLDGATLSLLKERNARGRRYRFSIDLGNVAKDA